MNIEHRFFDSDGVKLHYVEGGDGPLVLLIHGFPEFWYSWRHQIPALIAAGYRVVAPDMRGYNQSDAPSAVSSYALDTLANDIDALITHLGEERAHVIGHDWGAIIAWHFAMWHPDRIHQLGILNVPHPKRYEENVYKSPRQLLKSWYVFAFQLPWLPELFFRFGRCLALRMVLRLDPIRANAFTEEDIAKYVEAFSDYSRVRGPINYYRAAFRASLHTPLETPVIRAKTQIIWGTRDRFLEKFLATPTAEEVPDCRVNFLDASHWVQVDAFEEVNELLIRFLERPNAVETSEESAS